MNPTLPYADAEANRYRVPLEPAAKSALISGLLFFLTPIPTLLAVYHAIIGLDRIKRNGGRGRWQSWTGLGLGLVGVVFWIWVFMTLRQFQIASRVVDQAARVRELKDSLADYSLAHDGALPGTLADLGELSRRVECPILYLGANEKCWKLPQYTPIAFVDLSRTGHEEDIVIYSDLHQELFPRTKVPREIQLAFDRKRSTTNPVK
jgi:hypothetical protein